MSDIARRVERWNSVEWYCTGCGLRLALAGLGNDQLAILAGLKRRKPDRDGVPRYGLDHDAPASWSDGSFTRHPEVTLRAEVIDLLPDVIVL